MENIILNYIGRRLKELECEKCRSNKEIEINVAKTQELKQILELWENKKEVK